MDFASGITFVVDFAPLIESSVNAEGAKLNLGMSNYLVNADIFVHHFNS